MIDAGACTAEPTTVVDLAVEPPVVLRLGAGEPARLGMSGAASDDSDGMWRGAKPAGFMTQAPQSLALAPHSGIAALPENEATGIDGVLG